MYPVHCYKYLCISLYIDAYERYMNPLAAIATAQHSSGTFVDLLLLTHCAVC